MSTTDPETEPAAEPDATEPQADSETEPATQALARIDQLALSPEQTAFTSEQLAIIRVLKWDLTKLTPTRATYFIYFCGVHNVDPFAGEAMPFVTEDGEVIPILTIRGFRRQATLSGEYRGTGKFEYLDENGDWHHGWVPRTMGRPEACRVTVHRAGWPEPTEGTAYTEEVEVWEWIRPDGSAQPFRQLTRRWQTGNGLMVMIQKCAEAAALRRAFPRELDGFYVAEELERVTKERRDAARAAERAAGEAQRAAAYAAAHPGPVHEMREEGVQEGEVVEHQGEHVMDAVDRLRQRAQGQGEEEPALTDEEAAEAVERAEEDLADALDLIEETLSAEERAEMLRAELVVQADILGVPLATLVTRWEKTYDEPLAAWDDVMLLRVVSKHRRQVIARLWKDPDRQAQAAAYGTVGEDEVRSVEDLLGL